MRFTVEPDAALGGRDYYQVVDQFLGIHISGLLTEAQASVFAFALNALEDGRSLEAWDHANHNAWNYEGPRPE